MFMGNISYFCTMKLFERHLKERITFISIIIICLLSVLTTAHATNSSCNSDATSCNTTNGEQAQTEVQQDSITISLLTCGPRNNVYSLYGHTAIRYQNTTQGIDLAINYGVFSFDKPFFVLRFVFGLTDYEMGIMYFSDFMREYAPTGCGVFQQVLNLQPAEKEAIAKAFDVNYKIENRTYRYNYLYDNCTTRARDIIANNISGKIVYATSNKCGMSYRNLIRQYNNTHRWARFGNDLLLGIGADKHTSLTEQQFLPENLEHDFSKAKIQSANGVTRPLVKAEYWVLPKVSTTTPHTNMPSPSIVFAIIGFIIVTLTIVEHYTKRNFWGADILILTADGICGLILLAMVFSQHPTVRVNMQILLLNPLNIILLYQSIKSLRQGYVSKWLKIWTTLIILFLIGGLFQSYAEGMYYVASSLLIRYTSKYATNRINYKTK